MMMNCFCGMVDQWKVYFKPGLLSELFTIPNLQHTARSVSACAEPELSINWIKFCSSDNHYTTVPHCQRSIYAIRFGLSFAAVRYMSQNFLTISAGIEFHQLAQIC